MYSHKLESTPNNKSLIFSVKQKSKNTQTKKDSRPREWTGVFNHKRRLPTLPLLRSTIGVARLNFSVRDGKRWIPRAITTLISYQGIIHGEQDLDHKVTRQTIGGKSRAISTARLGYRYPHTCGLSTSSSATALRDI